MIRKIRFGGCTVEFRVPDLRAGTEFYSRLFGRAPDFEPHADFVEWEGFNNFWFQLAEGEPRPTYAMRLCVDDIVAEVARVQREVGARCSSITRIPGLVAFCNFNDPWGNILGLYQRLFIAGVPRVPGGSYHDCETESQPEISRPL